MPHRRLGDLGVGSKLDEGTHGVAKNVCLAVDLWPSDGCSRRWGRVASEVGPFRGARGRLVGDRVGSVPDTQTSSTPGRLVPGAIGQALPFGPSDERVALFSVDDPRTWSKEVVGHVSAQASQLRGRATDTSDLAIHQDEEEEFRYLLIGHQVLVFHATRLLDHEIGAIRRNGLAPLSEELVRTRIGEAHDHGFLDYGERRELSKGHLFAKGDEVWNREGQVCFFLSRRVLDHEVARIWNPLTIWGGEGIYFGPLSQGIKSRLERLGRPVIVVAGIDLSGGAWFNSVQPGLLKSFVGRWLEFDYYSSEVFYRAGVPGDQIIDMWVSGTRFLYDEGENRRVGSTGGAISPSRHPDGEQNELMIIKLRSIREQLKSSLFYTPMMLTLVGLVLGQVMLWVDEQVTDIPTDLTATVDSARGVLGVIAGATIAFAGVVFSVSLLLISLSSSQYSPRVVHGLFRDPVNKRVRWVS